VRVTSVFQDPTRWFTFDDPAKKRASPRCPRTSTPSQPSCGSSQSFHARGR